MHQFAGLLNCPRWMRPLDQHQFTARGYLTLSQNTQIPPALAVGDHLPPQIVDAPAARELPAGLTRLRDLKNHRACLPGVADAHCRFIEAFDRQVLAEAAVRQVWVSKLLAPVGVMVG